MASVVSSSPINLVYCASRLGNGVHSTAASLSSLFSLHIILRSSHKDWDSSHTTVTVFPPVLSPTTPQAIIVIKKAPNCYFSGSRAYKNLSHWNSTFCSSIVANFSWLFELRHNVHCKELDAEMYISPVPPFLMYKEREGR